MTGLLLRLGGFVAVLAVAFGAAFALGAAADPLTADEQASGHDEPETDAHGAEVTDDSGKAALPGLAVSASGYTLVPGEPDVAAGSDVPFRFTVMGPDGRPLTSYRPTHEKQLHLIVVRRDLVGFQHVHPTLAADGTWHVGLDLPLGGTYRVFADFAPGPSDDSLTLGTDIFVAGEFEPADVPPVATTDSVDGYTVRLDGAPKPGSETELTFTVTKDGQPVDLEPYLGAFGHLVSLRVGDLAYLHTHPTQDARAGERGGPTVEFGTEFPTTGTYRLYLDFKVGGVVRTAAFTVTPSSVTP
jgi:hypothetical protein